MGFHVSSVDDIAIHIFGFTSGHPGPMLVDAQRVWHAIIQVHLVNITIDPIYFLSLVDITLWLGSIVPKPRKLWWVEEGADSDGVVHHILVSELKDILAKCFDCFHNHIPVSIPNKIIIACRNIHIHRPGVIRIFNLKSMKYCL